MMFSHHQIDHSEAGRTIPARFSTPFRRLLLPRSHGFTIVELITVIVLTGILGAFAVPRFFERNAFDARAFADQTRTMLRYAQKTAIAQQRQVFVRLNANSVALCFDSACSATNLVLAPGGGNSGSKSTVLNCGASTVWFCEGIPQGVAIGLMYAGAPAKVDQTVFWFDQSGKPFAAVDNWGALNSTFISLEISLTGVTIPIIVEPETGYVH